MASPASLPPMLIQRLALQRGQSPTFVKDLVPHLTLLLNKEAVRNNQVASTALSHILAHLIELPPEDDLQTHDLEELYPKLAQVLTAGKINKSVVATLPSFGAIGPAIAAKADDVTGDYNPDLAQAIEAPLTTKPPEVSQEIEHDDEIKDLVDQGFRFLQSENLEKAVAIFQKSLARHRALCGDTSDTEAAEALRGMGWAQYRLNKNAEAEANFQESLTMYRTLHGNTPDAKVADALRGLGWVQSHLNKDAKAEAAFRKSLAMYRALYGHVSHDGATDALKGLGYNSIYTKC